MIGHRFNKEQEARIKELAAECVLDVTAIVARLGNAFNEMAEKIQRLAVAMAAIHPDWDGPVPAYEPPAPVPQSPTAEPLTPAEPSPESPPPNPAAVPSAPEAAGDRAARPLDPEEDTPVFNMPEEATPAMVGLIKENPGLLTVLLPIVKQDKPAAARLAEMRKAITAAAQ